MKTIIEYLQIFAAFIGAIFVLSFLGFLMLIDWIRGK